MTDTPAPPADDEIDRILDTFCIEWGRWFESNDTQYEESLEPLKEAKQAILALIDRKCREARVDELKRITLTGTPNSIDTAVISVPELADKGDVVLLSIDDRLAQLRKGEQG